MKIVNVTPEDTDLSEYKNRLQTLGPITHVDYEDIHLLFNQHDNEKEIDQKFWRAINYFDDRHRGTVDVLQFFVSQKGWPYDGNLLGRHMGESFGGRRVCVTKLRDGFEDTAVHEILHAVWSYIYQHTGIWLEDVLGVSEDGAIHGDADGYKEYEYEKHMQEVSPYFEQAVGEDMSDEYRNLAQKTIRLARKRIRQLRVQQNNENIYE